MKEADVPFFVFVFVLFCFVFSFRKTLIFFCFYQSWNFYQEKEKAEITQAKNREKWLCLLWKIFLLHPCTAVGDTYCHYGMYLLIRSSWCTSKPGASKFNYAWIVIQSYHLLKFGHWLQISSIPPPVLRCQYDINIGYGWWEQEKSATNTQNFSPWL